MDYDTGPLVNMNLTILSHNIWKGSHSDQVVKYYNY